MLISPEHSSAAFFEREPWLDLNVPYACREVRSHVLAEWNRPFADGHPRPVFLIESSCEREDNDRRMGDGYRVRRQVCGAVLSGARAGPAGDFMRFLAMIERGGALDGHRILQRNHAVTSPAT